MGLGDAEVDIVTPNARPCAILAGTPDLIEVADSPQYYRFVDSGFTVSFWYRANGLQVHNKGLVSKDKNGVVRQWYLRTESTDKIKFGSYDVVGSAEESFMTDSFNTQEWHHITAVYDGSLKTMYVDAVLQSGSDAVNDIKDGTTNIWFGTYYSATGQNAACMLSDIKLFNKGLSQAEITILSTGADIAVNNLVGRWRLQGDYDDEINANNGTPTGTSLGNVDAIAAISIKANRVTANDKHIMAMSANNQIIHAEVEEAP